MEPAVKTILALGASHIAVSTFSKHAAGGLILEQVAHQPLDVDPDRKEQWMTSIGLALGRLKPKDALKSVQSLILPGWAVLTKLLKVSRIEGEGQREVVGYEAENALPNGLDGLEWTYTVLRDDGFERDVFVQAVSSSFLARLLEVLELYSIRPSRIGELISMEWIALRTQYGGDSNASVLLDVGARSVTLIAGAAGELPFIRNFSFGGNLLTQALASKLGKPFGEAERLKLDWVHAKGETANLELLDQSAEGLVNRLVSEVQRSLALYRRQGSTGEPSRILLSGGASQLPGLADVVERKTGISTSFYDPFRGIRSGSKLPNAQTCCFTRVLPAHVGMAQPVSEKETEQANLLPRSCSSRLRLSRKKPWLFAAAGLFLMAGLVIGFKYHLQAWKLQRQVTALNAELKPLKTMSVQVKQAYESYIKLDTLATAKAELICHRQSWVAFLADLQDRLGSVENVWLESIEPEDSTIGGQPWRLRVTGRLLDRENPLSLVSGHSRGRVEVLLGSFEDSPFIQSVEDRRFDTSRPGILRFDFSLVTQSGRAF